MSADVYAFGEFLWDCLPSGRHVGGAPFNVSSHLAQLGVRAGLISAVGRDALGDELFEAAARLNVDTEFVTRAPAELESGRVTVSLDANSDATYDIVQPAAWDAISVTPEVLAAVSGCRALIYGSLAVRSKHNLDALERLLAVEGPLKLFDVNLRPPFADPALVFELARSAHLLKLNADEAQKLTNSLHSASSEGRQPHGSETISAACAALARATGVPKICVTRGAEGALYWENGVVTRATAPETRVRDSVGAGDAFMAAISYGLIQNFNPERLLECACRLGAFVASQNGATPRLPAELVERVCQGVCPSA